MKWEQISQNKFANQNDCRDEIMKIRFLLCWSHFKVTLNNMTEKKHWKNRLFLIFLKKTLIVMTKR